jgi:c-di-AMP phosphodiesterase-like protein
MSNTLRQWDEHVITGNRLSRELEDIETFIDKTKDAEVCFTSGTNGTIKINVISQEELQAIREKVILSVMGIRDNKEIELKKHMNSWKPATINQKFEAAIQDMVQSVKVPVIPKLEDGGTVNWDPDKESLSNIVDKPVPVETKSDMLERHLPEIEKLCKDEEVKVSDIADKYGVKKTDIYNFMTKHHISRPVPKKNDVFMDSKVKSKPGKERP